MFLRATLVAAAIVTAAIGSASPASAVPRCYENSNGSCVPDPTAAPAPGEGQPTARCCDGDYSFSQHHSGTCSGHHGVCEWLS